MLCSLRGSEHWSGAFGNTNTVRNIGHGAFGNANAVRNAGGGAFNNANLVRNVGRGVFGNANAGWNTWKQAVFWSNLNCKFEKKIAGKRTVGAVLD